MLDLPKEWNDLLLLLTDKTKNPAQLLKDSKQQILLKDIQILLESNSKNVVDKLLKLVQPTSGNIQSINQLKEIINLLNQIIPNAKTAPHERC